MGLWTGVGVRHGSRHGRCLLDRSMFGRWGEDAVTDGRGSLGASARRAAGVLVGILLEGSHATHCRVHTGFWVADLSANLGGQLRDGPRTRPSRVRDSLVGRVIRPEPWSPSSGAPAHGSKFGADEVDLPSSTDRAFVPLGQPWSRDRKPPMASRCSLSPARRQAVVERAESGLEQRFRPRADTCGLA